MLEEQSTSEPSAVRPHFYQPCPRPTSYFQEVAEVLRLLQKPWKCLMGLRSTDFDAMRMAVEASAYSPEVEGASVQKAQHAHQGSRLQIA